MIQASRAVGSGEGRAPTVDLQTVLDALESRRCRDLLRLLDSRPLTVREIGERVEIPRSTLYRSLNRLVDAGLVEESIRIGREGRHETQYARRIQDVLSL